MIYVVSIHLSDNSKEESQRMRINEEENSIGLPCGAFREFKQQRTFTNNYSFHNLISCT